MKVSIRFLILHRKHIPQKTIIKVIAMAGFNAVSSKLKYLSSVSIAKVRGKQISVVFYDGNPSNAIIPENTNNRGILLVPKPLNEAEWSAKHSQ